MEPLITWSTSALETLTLPLCWSLYVIHVLRALECVALPALRIPPPDTYLVIYIYLGAEALVSLAGVARIGTAFQIPRALPWAGIGQAVGLDERVDPPSRALAWQAERRGHSTKATTA